MVGVSEKGRAEYLGARFSSDPNFHWLVDSGATCHIISRQHMGDFHCEELNLPLPSLKGAGNAPIQVFGIVDVKFKVGNKKFVLSKAVVADIDVNVIGCHALMEAGWETVFGKQSGLYTGNLRLPLFMSERAWWLHVGSQKVGGGKKRTTNKNRPKPMDLDAVRTSDSKETGTETTASSKAEATKGLTQESSTQETVAAAAKGSSSKNVKSRSALLLSKLEPNQYGWQSLLCETLSQTLQKHSFQKTYQNKFSSSYKLPNYFSCQQNTSRLPKLQTKQQKHKQSQKYLCHPLLLDKLCTRKTKSI